MEHISESKFLELDKDVQKIFLDWWLDNFSFGNIFYHNYYGKCIAFEKWGGSLNCISSNVEGEHDIRFDEIIPLFTEGQLRKFIESKTSCIIKNNQYYHCDNELTTEGYTISLLDIKKPSVMSFYKNLGKDLLQAYWIVAVDIIKSDLKSM